MIVLDTSVLIRWINAPEKLSKKARKAIEKETKDGEILVSSISVWEVHLLIKKDRLKFFTDPDSWLEKVESLPFIRFMPIDNKIASLSVKLPDFNNPDPADRMIVATALISGATLVTSDKKILRYSHVQSLW